MIQPLPLWVLTNKYPAIYDGESATAIEMVAKVYGKMDEMIKDYNAFVTEINTAIAEFEASINADFNTFKNNIIEIVNNYIACIDTKINLQDEKIAEAIEYMKTNLIQTVNNLFAEALQNGDIVADLNIDYNSTTEELTFSIIGESEVEQ